MVNRMWRHCLRMADYMNGKSDTQAHGETILRTVVLVVVMSLASSCNPSPPKPDLTTRNSDIETSIA
jgi:hypothetical protein